MAATREQLESALRNAHAAGDTEAARKLANALKAAPATEPSSEKKASSAAEQGAARGKKLASGVLGPITSFGAGVGGGAFELTNLALRKAKEAQGASPEDARAYADAVLGALAKENPGSFSIGYGAGAVGSGAAAAKGAQVLGKSVPAVGRAIKAAAPVVGKPLSNAAKLAAGGAVSTAVSEANRGRSAEDVAEGAAASAGLSVALAPVVRGGGAAVNLARSALDKNKDEGFRVLARQMSKKGSTIAPEVLKQRAKDFKAATGRAPAIADLLRDEGAETVLNLTFRGDEASRTLAKAAAKRATDLQTDLAESIADGKPAGPALAEIQARAADRSAQAKSRQSAADATAKAKAEAAKNAYETTKVSARKQLSGARDVAQETLRARRKDFALAQARATAEADKEIAAATEKFAAATGKTTRSPGKVSVDEAAAARDNFAKAFFRKKGNVSVVLTKGELKELAKIARRRFPREDVTRKIGAIEDGKGPPLTLTELDNLAKSISSIGKTPGLKAPARIEAQRVREFAAKVRGYDDYLATYGDMSQEIAGMKRASSFGTKGNADAIEGFLKEATPSAAEGFRRTASREIQQIAQSPARSARFAQDLADDGDLRRQVAAVLGDGEASRLVEEAQDAVKTMRAAAEAPAQFRAENMRKLGAFREEIVRSVKAQKETLEKQVAEARAATKAVPPAEKMVDRSASSGAAALDKSVRTGRKILSPATSEFLAEATSLRPQQRKQAASAARTALKDSALEGPKGAAELARSLAEDAGLAQRLEALDPTEAAKLRQLGTEETESLRGVAKIGAGAQRNLSERDTAATRAAIDALLSGTGVGSLSFKVSAFRRFFSSNRVPPTAAAKLAEAIVDPAKTDDVLRRLAALGIEPRKVEEFARAAARASSRSVAASDSDE